VRAPGEKWTLLALTRELLSGAATASMKTAPVNQSPGPGAVSTLFRVICIQPSPRRLDLLNQPLQIGQRRG